MNWPDVVRHVYQRLRTESAHLGGDAILDAAANKLADAWRAEPPSESVELPAVVPTIYRAGDTELSFFSTIAQFGTAEDLTLAELHIETLHPASPGDAAALGALRADPRAALGGDVKPQ